METVKRVTVSLNKEDVRQLRELEQELGEGISSIIRRALQYFYYETKKKIE